MLDLFCGDQYISDFTISLIQAEPKVKRILLVAQCASTTEYPPPKFILAGRSIARTVATMRERTNGEENAVEIRKDHRAGRCMACGWQKFLRTVVIFIYTQANKYLDVPVKKESRRNCCNSPAARRVPKNADSICEQSNREAPGTQEKFISEFRNQEVPYACSR